MIRRVGVVIREHARVIMSPQNDLRTFPTSFRNDILNRMPQCLRLLDLHLPASGLKFLPHPFLDFSMALRPGNSRPESDLGFHILIGTLSVEEIDDRLQLSLKRKDIPANHTDKHESNQSQIDCD